MARAPRRTTRTQPPPEAAAYRHPEADSPLRPDVGTEAQFKKRKPPVTYRYDSSLSPALAWAGKAERVSFEVPTLPLFVHERLSTKAIVETLTGHKRDGQQTLFDLFADPQHSVTDQILRAYEHRDRWVNRMVLGDSLVVLNSLLHYEGLGGQVQMIYMDPPYGVKFGSNFQPFVRKRDVKHGDDGDMSREPETVQAYRDTWELGIHSYLTYMRDRLLLARELLAPTGSIFVQISDENLHHVREVMDEVFGGGNRCLTIALKKTGGQSSDLLPSVCDYLLWYSKDLKSVKSAYRQIYNLKEVGVGAGTGARYDQIELADGTRRSMTAKERDDPSTLPAGSRPYQLTSLINVEFRETTTVPFEFEGKVYHPGQNSHWATSIDGLKRLVAARRIQARDKTIAYVTYIDDFAAWPITNLWADLAGATGKTYVVQTSTSVVARCLLMTTDPGDLVLDPTCGSGTTAYVAEEWGRRWITIDTSRVPLALARQRLLTATFPYYQLKDEARGPVGGFVYVRKQNKKGEEVGGIVPHVTLKGIANDEPPAEEVLVDRPEEAAKVTRVTGPFCVEATIPQPVDWEETDGGEAPEDARTSADRMLEVLRRSPILRLEGNRTVTFKNVRPPAKTLSLSAEAVVANGAEKAVAFVFGPENGAVSERLVYGAAREAHAKGYTHLYVIGFAIQPNARALIDQSEATVGVPATYCQATPDLVMGDLLKTMRSSQIFSVCGLPEIAVRRAKAEKRGAPLRYTVELLGLDVFDPVEMETEHRKGDDVPAWFLDTDYNGLSFHVSQAFFPKTAAWDGLQRALKGSYGDSVWDHLAGTTSAPFEGGGHGRIAVKVIDDRGNELLVVKDLEHATT
ncbi:MAG: site-specific DNA-methyltransferase [Planctomycetes bacterium]|nr:site-specific DNA-methyltransferase [Planctomycetota bacterium]